MIKDLLKLIFFYALPLFGIAIVLFIASESFPIVDDLLRGNYKGPTVTVINVVLVISMFVIWCWGYKGFVDHKRAAALLKIAGLFLLFAPLRFFIWGDPLEILVRIHTLQNLQLPSSIFISAAYGTILFAIASLMWPSDARGNR